MSRDIEQACRAAIRDERIAALADRIAARADGISPHAVAALLVTAEELLRTSIQLRDAWTRSVSDHADARIAYAHAATDASDAIRMCCAQIDD
jgi:hypothetical protein